MSIHRLLMRSFSEFCGGMALNVNVKHFAWPDLWRYRWPRGKIFSTSSEKSRPGIFISDWIFPPRLLVTEIVWRGRNGTPPPPPAEGRGRTRPSRARVNCRSDDATGYVTCFFLFSRASSASLTQIIKYRCLGPTWARPTTDSDYALPQPWLQLYIELKLCTYTGWRPVVF